MNKYRLYVLQHMPKVLTQLDRDVHSKTYGSFDRNYWHLKVHDFSSAILQQSTLTLALVYATDFKGNIYFRNPCIKEWAIAGLRYMSKIQLNDGSFNEYYPNEHGFPPTAFNLMAGSYAYKLLELDDGVVITSLHKAAVWISKHDEKNAYNQEAAALAGLCLFDLINDSQEFKDSIEEKLRILKSAFCDEGWLPEQGGADIGYLSVALDMLMECYRVSHNERIKVLSNKIISFLSYFVHPDGTVGGEYGSRNTIYYMPAGLENAISFDINKELASGIVSKVFGQKDMVNDFMLSVDERYNTHYVMHSYLRAIRYSLNSEAINKKVMLPFETVVFKRFERAGLAVYSSSNSYAVVSASKGGVVKIYKGDVPVLCDCGYRIPIKFGETAATNWQSSDYSIDYGDDKIKVKGNFHVVKQKTQNPMYMISLRILGFFMGKRLNSLLKKMTIFQNNEFDASFEREIRFKEDLVVIEDRIYNPTEFEIEEASNISLRLVASGNFFNRTDMLTAKRERYGTGKILHRVRRIGMNPNMIETVVDNGT